MLKVVITKKKDKRSISQTVTKKFFFYVITWYRDTYFTKKINIPTFKTYWENRNFFFVFVFYLFFLEHKTFIKEKDETSTHYRRFVHRQKQDIFTKRSLFD